MAGRDRADRVRSASLSVLSAVTATWCLLAQPPSWYGDAQYYVQSGRLWAEGIVTYAGSRIGDRYVVVWLYQQAVERLGASLDALSIALAMAFLVAALAVIYLLHTIGASPRRAALASILAVAVLATEGNVERLAPFMKIPMTEALFLTAMLLAVACWWAVVRGGGHGLAALGAIGLFVGLAATLRSESPLLLGAFAAAMLLRRGPGQTRRQLVAITVMLTCGAAGWLATPRGWPLLFPGERPPTYRWMYLVYYPMFYLHDPAAGPANAALARLGTPRPENVPLITQMIRRGYLDGRVAEVDGLFLRGFVEILRQHPGRVLGFMAKEIGMHAVEPRLATGIDRRTFAERWTASRGALETLDARRIEASAPQGNDAFWATATLGDRRLAFADLARRSAPHWWPIVTLPGWLLPLSAAVVIARWRRAGPGRVVAAIFLLYAVVTVTLTAAAQGYHERYAHFPLILSALALLTVVTAARAPIASPSGEASLPSSRCARE
jgi:hypothetical protein